MAAIRKVKEGQEFRFCNGGIARTVAECRLEISGLSDMEFAHHVNDSKNDFYTWMRDCLDPALAEKIRGVSNKIDLVEALKTKK